MIASIFKNFGYYEKFIKPEELEEINELKKKFIDYYFNPKVTKPKVSEQIKKEVQEELRLKDEAQGIKLTVTEKIN